MARVHQPPIRRNRPPGDGHLDSRASLALPAPPAGWMGQRALLGTQVPPATGCPQARLGAPSHCPQTPAHLLRAVRSWTVGMVGRREIDTGLWLPTHTHKSIPRARHSALRGGSQIRGRAGSRLPLSGLFLGHSSHEAPSPLVCCLLGTSLPTLTEGGPAGHAVPGTGQAVTLGFTSLAPGTCGGSQPRRGGADKTLSAAWAGRQGPGVASLPQ